MKTFLLVICYSGLKTPKHTQKKKVLVLSMWTLFVISMSLQTRAFIMNLMNMKMVMVENRSCVFSLQENIKHFNRLFWILKILHAFHVNLCPSIRAKLIPDDTHSTIYMLHYQQVLSKAVTSFSNHKLPLLWLGQLGQSGRLLACWSTINYQTIQTKGGWEYVNS